MNRYLVILLIFIQVPQYSKAQNFQSTDFNIEDNECYIVARGTRSKQSFLSKRFNILNDSITHIGIGLSTDSGFRIYNVNPVRRGNALFIEDLGSYLDETDLVYAGIWKLRLNDHEKERLRKVLTYWKGRLVEFDTEFMVGNGDSVLYCSEFCWQITTMLSGNFKFGLKEMETGAIGLEGILKRKKLIYVPVDYFLSFSALEYCGSWREQNFKF